MSDQTTATAFTITDEQREFRSAVRAFLAHHSPETEVRRVMESPRATTRRCGAPWPIS